MLALRLVAHLRFAASEPLSSGKAASASSSFPLSACKQHCSSLVSVCPSVCLFFSPTSERGNNNSSRERKTKHLANNHRQIELPGWLMKGRKQDKSRTKRNKTHGQSGTHSNNAPLTRKLMTNLGSSWMGRWNCTTTTTKTTRYCVFWCPATSNIFADAN